MDTRNWTVLFPAGIEAALALIYFAGSVNLLLLVRAAVASVPQDADEIRGLTIGFVACVVFAVISIRAAMGLWRRRTWAWIMAVGLNLFIIGALLVGPLTGDELEAELAWVLLSFVLVTVPLILPGVARTYWTNRKRSRS